MVQMQICISEVNNNKINQIKNILEYRRKSAIIDLILTVFLNNTDIDDFCKEVIAKKTLSIEDLKW